MELIVWSELIPGAARRRLVVGFEAPAVDSAKDTICVVVGIMRRVVFFVVVELNRSQRKDDRFCGYSQARRFAHHNRNEQLRLVVAAFELLERTG